MFCSKCGSSNSEASRFCAECGARLARDDKSTASISSERPVERAGADAAAGPAAAEEFYKAAIGPHRQDYYLRKFAQFDRGEGRLSWNWPALFVTLYWLIYRKMWLKALVYFLLPYLVAIALGIASGVSGSDGSAVAAGYLLFLAATFIVPPLYADAVYHKHCKKKIDEAKLNFSDDRSRLMAVQKGGGVSRILMILIAVFVLISMIGILAAVAIPAYQRYVERARAAQQDQSHLVLPAEQR